MPAASPAATRSRRRSTLTVDGDAARRSRLIEAGLTFPPGVGGLSTMRLVCEFERALAAPIAARRPTIAFADTSFPERLGWREIVVDRLRRRRRRDRRRAPRRRARPSA